MITQGSDIEQVEAFKTALLEAKGHKSKILKSNKVNLMNNYYSPKSASTYNHNRNNDDDSMIKKKCSLVLIKCSSDLQESSTLSS